MTAASTKAVTTLSRKDYEAAKVAQSELDLATATAKELTDAKAAVEKYELKIEDARIAAGAMRHLVVELAGNKWINILERSLQSVVNEGENIKNYYLNDARSLVRRLEGETPSDDRI
jgi:hypothetical protein